MESIIPLLASSALFGEPLALLLASFAILGILDIIGGKRIDVNNILFFAAVFAIIFLYSINFDIPKFAASSSTLKLAEVFGSIAILLLLPKVGSGDKIFLATTFLIYPFWLMWGIILLALLLTRPVFKLISFFVKSGNMSVPFYPFLFLSTAIISALIFIVL
ncbi:MAG: hypothetical protein NTX79_02835 [Candidatus Micrarchaeota archaeon]|nr:hypothetical protein [Candidatus Micrarchaeota archaeon]